MAMGHEPAKRAEVHRCPLFTAVHSEHSCWVSVSVITSADCWGPLAERMADRLLELKAQDALKT